MVSNCDSKASSAPDAPTPPRELLCELCRQFYGLGWVSGTGGGISLREEGLIYMAPSGVQKERLRPEDIFVLDAAGVVVEAPIAGLRLSQCAPLFMGAYKLRNAGAVLHSHSLNAAAATLLFDKMFRSQNWEMQKGVEGHGAFDTLEVPIIENTGQESDLTEALERAIRDHPKTRAVLVRNHGVYVWGTDWRQAKTQAECYDYLFEAACRMRQLGIVP